MRSITGHLIPTIGETYIYIAGKKIAVTVSKNQKFDLLLGFDALKVLNAQVDCNKHAIKLNKKWYQSIEMDNNEFCEIYGAVDNTNTDIDDILRKHENIFEESPSGILSQTNVTTCKIETGNHAPIKQRPYKVPLNKRKVIDEEIDKMLKSGVIRPSNSNWASPVLIVPKKSGENRFCIDYRKVNSITEEYVTVLPKINDIFDELNNASYFTALDLRSAYWQIPMDNKSIKKSAFCTHRGT